MYKLVKSIFNTDRYTLECNKESRIGDTSGQVLSEVSVIAEFMIDGWEFVVKQLSIPELYIFEHKKKIVLYIHGYDSSYDDREFSYASSEYIDILNKGLFKLNLANGLGVNNEEWE